MPDRRRYGRTPDTVCLLAALTIVGVFLTVTGNVPISVQELVPPAVGILWQTTFTIAAALSLVGLLWRDPLIGWVLELSGRIALAGTAAGYTVALWDSASHWGTALVTLIIASIAAGSIGRIWQLVRRYKEFETAIRAQRDVRRTLGD